MPAYKVSQAAFDDLVDIGAYTQQEWDISQRDRYLRDIETRFETLASNAAKAPRSTKVAFDAIKCCCFAFAAITSPCVTLPYRFTHFYAGSIAWSSLSIANTCSSISP